MRLVHQYQLAVAAALVFSSGVSGTAAGEAEQQCEALRIPEWRTANYDESFFRDRITCGLDALVYWMQSSAYRTGHPEQRTKFERLVCGNAEQVAMVNREIQDECARVLADVDAWRQTHRGARQPSFWIILALRAPDRITPETRRIICQTLQALDLSSKQCGYVNWIGVSGANGANVHGYLTPLTLAPALIDDPEVRRAGERALLSELAHMNQTGDMGEFNLLESHWNGTASWEVMKRYIPDPRLRRMARMISERLWINRFLTWSAAVERNTGPGSRMAPSEWLGCDGERSLFATGLNRPIWLNIFFPWGVWDSRAFRIGWPLSQTQAFLPELPVYLHDLAWHKSMPNELQCRVALRHWAPYPKLEGLPQPDRYRPAKYVNYQTRHYTLGSTTSSWIVNTCVVAASAWWNNSRAAGAPIGSPKRFCVLYPHYVFNGMSFLDKGDIIFENADGQPVKDHKGGIGGPYLREFIDFGRVGTLQHRNTLLLSYTPKPRTHHQGQILVKDTVQRASAGMFLFRWDDGFDGLYINREPVKSLPHEVAPGDWWFIEDGPVYAAVRPLKATRLRGGRTLLEKRNRHVVLYQDNVAADDVAGIADADWVKARSGFVVEMGDRDEFGSFANFQDEILSGQVATDEAEGFVRHVGYRRGDRELRMRWHCYLEDYPTRKINGDADPWTRYAQSPEFAVGDRGRLAVKDAALETRCEKTWWLLSCEPSQTWVVYQPNSGQRLPMTLECPIGRIVCDEVPFGKIAICRTAAGDMAVEADLEGTPGPLRLDGEASSVSARLNGTEHNAKREKSGGWTVGWK